MVDKIRCPACRSVNLDESLPDFDAVCNGCGFVVLNFDSVVEPNLETAESAADQALPEESWSEFATATNSSEENLISSISVLDRVVTELDYADQVSQKAVNLFADAVKKRITEGQPTKATISALLYLAGRECGDVRPIAILQDYVDCDSNRISKLVRKLQIELELEYSGRFPQEYLSYLQNELGYTDDHADTAESLLVRASEQGITNGKQPVGFAAAALYCTATEIESQRTLAAVAGVSKETIRVRVRDLRRAGLAPE